MGKYYLGCVLIAALAVAVPVAAFTYLRTGMALLVTLAYVALMPLVLKFAFRGVVGAVNAAARRAQERMVKLQKMMSEAQVTVHRFEEVPEPPAEKMKDGQLVEKEEGPHRYMLLDCTISLPMQEDISWEPCLLSLEQEDQAAQPALPGPGDSGSDDSGSIDDDVRDNIMASRVWYALVLPEKNEAEVPDELQSPARLRIIFGCPAAMKGTVYLKYVDTDLCELTLPMTAER